MNERLTPVTPEITLCHDSFGDPDDPTVLLIMGLGTQMIAWQAEFCELIAGRGFHVVRFDNRDIGHSTHLDFPPPHVFKTVTRSLPDEQYSLEDMAGDTAALIERLELGPVHVVGASMGGMIAQLLAARRPELTSSLISIMSNTGSRLTGQPALSVYRQFFKVAPTEREAFIEHMLALFSIIGSSGLGSDEDETRALIAASYDRDRDPAGVGRQLGAVAKSGNRTGSLRRIQAPTLVIHGSADKLIRPSGGKATAKAIPGAELLMIEGMGHDLPRGAWARIVDGIERTAARAASRRATVGV